MASSQALNLDNIKRILHKSILSLSNSNDRYMTSASFSFVVMIILCRTLTLSPRPVCVSCVVCSDCAEGGPAGEGWGGGSGNDSGGFPAGRPRAGARRRAVRELRHPGPGQQQGGLLMCSRPPSSPPPPSPLPQAPLDRTPTDWVLMVRGV